MNNTKKIIAVLIVLVIGILVLSLSKSKPTPTPIINTQVLPSATPEGTPMDVSELKIEDLKIGTGSAVKSGDTVVMNYTGTLLNGTKFDSSYDRGVPFTTQIGVGQVIPGWDQGIPGMKVGGVRKLTIPSSMAYGVNGIPGAIPGSAALIFEVQLVAIK